MASDSTVEVRITADASGLQSGAEQASDSAAQLSEKLKEIQGAAGAGAEGMSALEAAYYSVSGPAQQAAESASTLADALSSGIPSASGFVARTLGLVGHQSRGRTRAGAIAIN